MRRAKIPDTTCVALLPRDSESLTSQSGPTGLRKIWGNGENKKHISDHVVGVATTSANHTPKISIS